MAANAAATTYESQLLRASRSRSCRRYRQSALSGYLPILACPSYVCAAVQASLPICPSAVRGFQSKPPWLLAQPPPRMKASCSALRAPAAAAGINNPPYRATCRYWLARPMSVQLCKRACPSAHPQSRAFKAKREHLPSFFPEGKMFSLLVLLHPDCASLSTNPGTDFRIYLSADSGTGLFCAFWAVGTVTCFSPGLPEPEAGLRRHW